MHESSYLSMEKFKNQYLDKSTNLKILDVGSYDSNNPPYNYGLLFKEKNWKYWGMDIKKGSNVDIVAKDIYNWVEIENESYDVVISGQAFEHMDYFWKAAEEMTRILKPNGYLCIIVPSAGPVHRNPVDCYRFKEDGMKAIAKYVKLNMLEIYMNHDNQWHDCVLVARKDEKNLEDRINNLENKIDLILKKLE